MIVTSRNSHLTHGLGINTFPWALAAVGGAKAGPNACPQDGCGAHVWTAASSYEEENKKYIKTNLDLLPLFFLTYIECLCVCFKLLWSF